MREEKFGPLTVRLAGGRDREGGGDGPVVVLMHGFGAPGTDLVPLWRVLDVPPSVRFVFPEAPLALPREYGAGRAWWMIDLERMQRAMAGESFDRGDEVPDGMVEARAQVVELLGEVERRMAPPKLVLGGFSQGAMVACDVAFSTATKLDALILLSGTLLAQSAWAAGAKARAGLPVVQSHGRADPLLSFAAATKLRDLMLAAGLDVEFVEHNGGHEIPDRVLDRAGALVSRVAG